MDAIYLCGVYKDSDRSVKDRARSYQYFWVEADREPLLRLSTIINPANKSVESRT